MRIYGGMQWKLLKIRMQHAPCLLSADYTEKKVSSIENYDDAVAAILRLITMSASHIAFHIPIQCILINV